VNLVDWGNYIAVILRGGSSVRLSLLLAQDDAALCLQQDLLAKECIALQLLRFLALDNIQKVTI